MFTDEIMNTNQGNEYAPQFGCITCGGCSGCKGCDGCKADKVDTPPIKKH